MQDLFEKSFKETIQQLLPLVEKAGKAIMDVYNDPLLFKDVEYKSDTSPLTRADKISHEIIKEGLNKIFPSIPVLSEEQKEVSYNERKNWKLFWMVDPLDGTKEFLKRNGQFTVNIALIENGYPVLGIIGYPEKKISYSGARKAGAFKHLNGQETLINVSKKTKSLKVVRSSSHPSPEETEVFKKFDIDSVLEMGSSLKFCLIAEGKADLYYRYGPTMEWDTAAGQAILEAAGGSVFKNTSSEKLSYNKESLLNPSFICVATDKLPLQE